MPKYTAMTIFHHCNHTKWWPNSLKSGRSVVDNHTTTTQKIQYNQGFSAFRGRSGRIFNFSENFKTLSCKNRENAIKSMRVWVWNQKYCHFDHFYHSEMRKFLINQGFLHIFTVVVLPRNDHRTTTSTTHITAKEVMLMIVCDLV